MYNVDMKDMTALEANATPPKEAFPASSEPVSAMALGTLPPTAEPLPDLDYYSLLDRIASYRGNPHRFLLRFLEDPDAHITEILRSIGVSIGSYNRWCYELQGFKETRNAIRANRPDLRKTAALAIFEGRTIPIAKAMADRAEGTNRDAQRAGERILETVGVLPKGNDQLQPAPIQVVTHTYVLVQPGPQPTNVTVEGQAKGAKMLNSGKAPQSSG